MADENRIEGAARNVSGKLQDAVGGLVGDTKTQARGKANQVQGNAQNALGSAMDTAEAVDRQRLRCGQGQAARRPSGGSLRRFRPAHTDPHAARLVSKEQRRAEADSGDATTCRDRASMALPNAGFEVIQIPANQAHAALPLQQEPKIEMARVNASQTSPGQPPL